MKKLIPLFCCLLVMILVVGCSCYYASEDLPFSNTPITSEDVAKEYQKCLEAERLYWLW